MFRLPVTDADTADGLAALDCKSFQFAAIVDIRAFQVVTRRPGVGEIVAVREQDAVAHLVLRDRELDDLAVPNALEVQSHGRVELARVAEIPDNRALLQAIHFYLDIDVESLVGLIAVTEQDTGRIAQHPVANVLSRGIRRGEGHGDIHSLPG